MDFQKYIEVFEKEVIIKGFEQGVLGSKKEEVVPIRNGKLSNTDFGEFIGKTFDYDKMLSINYYGLFKLSNGIMFATEKARRMFPDVRSIKAPVVYFNSIKIEQIKLLSPETFFNFPEFREEIIRVRWKKELKK